MTKLSDDELLQKVFVLRGNLMEIAEELKRRIKEDEN